MCDTFVALPSVTADGSAIFGKNSDREPNEAQSLEYYPAQTYKPGSTLQCTYQKIPQARDALEQRLMADASKTRPGERWQVSQTAFKHGREATHKWIAKVQELPAQKRPKAYYRYFWQRQNKKAGLAISL